MLLIVELLSGMPPLFAPATSALRTPPAVTLSGHHLKSLGLLLLMASIRKVIFLQRNDRELKGCYFQLLFGVSCYGKT